MSGCRVLPVPPPEATEKYFLPNSIHSFLYVPATGCWKRVGLVELPVIDTMGRMHGDAQFAGSSSVPAHVEMMGVIGMGNNPMVGATVAVAVAIENASK